jgi:hypothetical protein
MDTIALLCSICKERSAFPECILLPHGSLLHSVTYFLLVHFFKKYPQGAMACKTSCQALAEHRRRKLGCKFWSAQFGRMADKAVVIKDREA